MTVPTPLLRPQDVARMLGLSLPRVYQMAERGEIASYKLERAVRFDPADVARYIAEHRRERRAS